MRVADYLFRFVAGEGVREVFLLPGGGAMYLVDALGCNPDLTFVPTHHEQAAAIAAEAYCRANGNLGVVLVTTGPGGLNALTGVAGAWIESVPMLVISGQVKRADRMGDSGVRQMGVQEVDIVSLARPVTKYAVTVDDPQDIRYHLEKAVHLARAGRQGPVWLDIPLDVQAAPVDPERLVGFTPQASSVTAVADRLQGAAAETLKLLRQAERPLFLAGHGVRLAGGVDAFRRLYETLQVPVVTTWNAMDLIPYDHPLCVGRPGSVALRGPNFAIQNCDLLVSMGARLDNVVTGYDTPGLARAARKVVIDVDPAELDKLDLEIAVRVQADAKDFIEALLRATPPAAECDPWRERCRAWKARYPVCDGQPFAESGPISHYHFVDTLSQELPEGQWVITGSSGLAVEVFYTVFANKRGQRVFLTSGLGAMGYGLPAAIGGCLGSGRQPVVSIEGDGSLQLNVQELATLHQQGLPVRMFVMNNRGYASIRNTQRTYFDSRFVATGPEAGLFMPDPVALAEAVGLPTLRIRDAGELRDGIREALAHPGPLLCDVNVMRDEALWPKLSAMPQADGSMASMPLEDMTPLLSLEELRENMSVALHPTSRAIRQARS